MKKRWIFILLTILFVWVVVTRFTELTQLKDTLAQGQWTWVLAAILSQIAYYTVFAGSYQAAFRTVGIQTRTRDLIPVTLASIFINVVVPAGGAGGAALFAEDLARRDKPASRAAAGVLLQMIADFSAFTLVLIPGMIYLFIEHDLKIYEIIAVVILLLITVGLSSILLLGIWNPKLLQSLFNWAQRTTNWVYGRLNRSLSLADDWAKKNAEEFGQASAAVAEHTFDLLRTIGIACVAHLLDLVTLFLLFRAFNQPISLGALVAGYAIGILFWIVSITPQGIGVVEGMMTLTFTSLGIPVGVAAAVALTFRGLTFWLPMMLGFIAVQRMHTLPATRRTLTEKWSVRFAVFLVALMGIINVLSAVTPSLMDRIKIMQQISPLEMRHGGHLTAALAGFALLVLAGNLGRRKRAAWWLTMGVLGLSVVSHLVKGLDYEEALLASALMVLLWLMRAHFHARSDRPSIQQGLRVLAWAALFTLAYGVTGFYLLDRHYSINFGFWAALQQTVVMFTQFYDPGLVPITRFGKFFADSIYIVGAVTFGYAGIMLLRPVFVRDPATLSERQKAEGIIKQYGRSSLARFLLFDDKRYFFTPQGSVIGYMLVGRTAVTLGDPIGPQEDLLVCIRAFTEFCQLNDWLAVFYQTLPETLDLYKKANFDALSVGEEGIVNLETFTMEGKESKPLRAPVNKLTNAGYQFILHQPPIEDELIEELHSISDEWLTMMQGTEKRFSLGWFDDDYIRNSPIAAVHTPEGWISAFANLLPEYQLNEITIDLMRRRHEIENGTMEFLFASMFQWAKSQGYQTFNLGLSSLSGVGEKPDDPAIEKVMHWVYEHVNQFYNFKGLHSFKEKFHPLWSPRYLIYSGNANMANAWLAVVQANSGDGKLISSFRKK
jgi:phosphatidylglycerol lysyltransferase